MIIFLLFFNLVFSTDELSYPREKGWTPEEETVRYWKDIGDDELQRAIKLAKIETKAKNVILFMGDGMGLPTVLAGRIEKGRAKGENGEKFKMWSYSRTCLRGNF